MRNNFYKTLGEYFIFSRFYISIIAVVMVAETKLLFHLSPIIETEFMAFIFFSTLASYNFHWYLSPMRFTTKRSRWSVENKQLHLWLTLIASGIALALLLLFLKKFLLEIGIAVLLTFFYSASKIPIKIFSNLKFMASIKTIILAMVWTYTTVLLPLLISGKSFSNTEIYYVLAKFFFIFSICILFDYRDKEVDEKEGAKNMMSFLSEKKINVLYYVSLGLSALFIFLLMKEFSTIKIFLLLIPVAILFFIYKKSKTNFSDFLYYVILDGLMMLSGLVLIIFQYFW